MEVITLARERPGDMIRSWWVELISAVAGIRRQPVGDANPSLCQKQNPIHR